MEQTGAKWYYRQDGRTAGPFSEAELRAIAASGQLKPQAMVCQAGGPKWIPATSVPGLIAHHTAVPPPLPVSARPSSAQRPGASRAAIVPPPLPAAALHPQAPASASRVTGFRSKDSALRPPLSLQFNPVAVQSKVGRTWGWFALAIGGVALSLTVISGGLLLVLVPFFVLVGGFFPFIQLGLSRHLAMVAHDVQLIDDTNEEPLREIVSMVRDLSAAAGLEECPQVGIYESPDMNAFATGSSRRQSLVAFSTGLLEQMDPESVAAVAAHEIGHVASGDMVTMTLVQSAVRTCATVITFPLAAWAFFVRHSDNAGSLARILSVLVKEAASYLLLFIGLLVERAFSRKREFEADAVAARLIHPDAMIRALRKLSTDEETAPPEQAAYAAFKVNTSPSWLDILSTHPSLERRIEALSRHPN